MIGLDHPNPRSRDSPDFRSPAETLGRAHLSRVRTEVVTRWRGYPSTHWYKRIIRTDQLGLIGPEPVRLGPRVGVVQLSPETTDDELHAYPHYLQTLCGLTERRRAHALPEQRRAPPLPRSHRQGIEQLRDEAKRADDQATFERATTVLADGSDGLPSQPEDARRSALLALAGEDGFGHASAAAERLELGVSFDDALLSRDYDSL